MDSLYYSPPYNYYYPNRFRTFPYGYNRKNRYQNAPKNEFSQNNTSETQNPKVSKQNSNSSMEPEPRETSSSSSKPIFEIFGIKLYFDDILLVSLIFFLYNEGVQDQSIFIALILLLLS